MARILFPGRFQPFHNAHLRLLKKLLQEYDSVLLAIGTSQEPNESNPFQPSEVKKMIELAAKTEGLPADKIIFSYLPNEENDDAWVSHLLRYVPRNSFDAVFSNNPRVIKQLEKAEIPCFSCKMVEPEKYNATNVRFLLRGEGEWKKLVPKPVARFIEKRRRLPR